MPSTELHGMDIASAPVVESSLTSSSNACSRQCEAIVVAGWISPVAAGWPDT